MPLTDDYAIATITNLPNIKCNSTDDTLSLSSLRAVD